MLKSSQPLDPKVAERLGLDDEHELDVENDEILPQHIGTMFDDIFADDKRRRPGLRTRIHGRIRCLKDAFYSVRRTAQSHRKWHATLRDLQPWNGFNDLISVMLTQMQNYVRFEEKHGHLTPECTEQKIASTKSTMASCWSA